CRPVRTNRFALAPGRRRLARRPLRLQQVKVADGGLGNYLRGRGRGAVHSIGVAGRGGTSPAGLELRPPRDRQHWGKGFVVPSRRRGE
ncbi:MAG TPA: hypothetical protein VEJ84_02825, partial [Acidimicrobiales bacterium]|nr:hypothetical protein [Acidimicrobiales bacterium]